MLYSKITSVIRLYLIAICCGKTKFLFILIQDTGRAAASTCLTTADCPIGYVHFADSCYYFSTESLDWFRAESSCRGHNARLAEIDNKQQSDFLISEAKKIGGPGYWLAIGGRDDIVEGTWLWASTDKPFTYTDWLPGQPSNGGSTGNEDCVHLFGQYNMLWNDASCLYPNYRYICEKPFADGEQSGPVIGK